MKKLFLAVVAVLALGSAVSAQVADNCALVHQVMTDLQKDRQLTAYRGRLILGGNYESKVNFAGFARTSLIVGSFSSSFIAETAPTAQKAEALKQYMTSIEQLKTCLKGEGFKMNTTTNDYVTETVFADPRPTHLTVTVGLFAIADQYVVTMAVRKTNPTAGPQTK